MRHAHLRPLLVTPWETRSHCCNRLGKINYACSDSMGLARARAQQPASWFMLSEMLAVICSPLFIIIQSWLSQTRRTFTQLFFLIRAYVFHRLHMSLVIFIRVPYSSALFRLGFVCRKSRIAFVIIVSSTSLLRCTSHIKWDVKVSKRKPNRNGYIRILFGSVSLSLSAESIQHTNMFANMYPLGAATGHNDAPCSKSSFAAPECHPFTSRLWTVKGQWWA